MAVEQMVGFGPKQAWLAIRDGNPTQLLDALRLRDLGEVPWRSGIDLAYLTDDRLVLTPRLPGPDGTAWLLAVGRWLLGKGSTVDIAELSAALATEVQLFASYRVSELHRWERAAGGELLRAFGYVGETGELTQWVGDPDEVERAMRLPAKPDDESDIVVSESDVLRMAAHWSLDPSTLDRRPAPGPLRVAAV